MAYRDLIETATFDALADVTGVERTNLHSGIRLSDLGTNLPIPGFNAQLQKHLSPYLIPGARERLGEIIVFAAPVTVGDLIDHVSSFISDEDFDIRWPPKR